MSALKGTLQNETTATTTPASGDAAATRAPDKPASVFDFRPTACGACGGERARLLGWRGGDAHHGGAGVRTRIVRCLDCSHIYPNPMPFPARSLDDLYTDTDDYFQGHDVDAKKQSALDKMAYFEKTLGRRGRYLDVACGRGESLWAARESGWEYEGVDASSAYLEWAEANLGVRGRLGTLDEIKFPDNHFDAITMNAIIEHLYDPYATMSEVFRILKPGGLLWFDAPNEDGLYQRMGNLYMRAQRRDWVVTLAPTFPPYHVQGFNPRSLKRLLARVNFQIEQFTMGGAIWPPQGVMTWRKQAEYRAAKLIDWVGRHTGAAIYMDVIARKPLS
ncbi:MAG TPA: class I SAM-dependent methyltransferase [Pyrinomonadaceae bacterium]|nr:class I SAM-dependent methyltransferase [Pyrinomonadaceae bacterium]